MMQVKCLHAMKSRGGSAVERRASSVDVAERLAVQLTGHQHGWATAVEGARSALAWVHERGRGALALLDDELQAALELLLAAIRRDRPDGAAQIAALWKAHELE